MNVEQGREGWEIFIYWRKVMYDNQDRYAKGQKEISLVGFQPHIQWLSLKTFPSKCSSCLLFVLTVPCSIVTCFYLCHNAEPRNSGDYRLSYRKSYTVLGSQGISFVKVWHAVGAHFFFGLSSCLLLPQLGMMFEEERSKSQALHVFPFNSEKKRGGVALQVVISSFSVPFSCTEK